MDWTSSLDGCITTLNLIRLFGQFIEKLLLSDGEGLMAANCAELKEQRTIQHHPDISHVCGRRTVIRRHLLIVSFCGGWSRKYSSSVDFATYVNDGYM
jgi:hypothetical protein